MDAEEKEAAEEPEVGVSSSQGDGPAVILVLWNM